jgi:hypothetical protein
MGAAAQPVAAEKSIPATSWRKSFEKGIRTLRIAQYSGT